MNVGMKNIALLNVGRRRDPQAFEPSADVDTPAPPVGFNLNPDGHLVVTGGTGRGKTRILAAMAEVACNEMDVYVADVWLHERDVFAVRPSVIAGKASTLPGIAELLEKVRDIAVARAEGPPPASPGRARPILLVIDEGWIFLADDGSSQDREARKRSRAALELISAHAEAAGITVLLAAQGASLVQCLDLLKCDPSQMSVLDLGSSLPNWGGEELYTTQGISPAYTFGRRQALYTRGSSTSEVVNIPSL